MDPTVPKSAALLLDFIGQVVSGGGLLCRAAASGLSFGH